MSNIQDVVTKLTESLQETLEKTQTSLQDRQKEIVGQLGELTKDMSTGATFETSAFEKASQDMEEAVENAAKAVEEIVKQVEKAVGGSLSGEK